MSDEFLSKLCCPVIRMQIMGNNCRLNPEAVLKIFECLLKKFCGLIIFQISQMLTHDCIMPFCQCKCILQFSSTPKDLRHFNSKFNRVGDISPCPPDHDNL